MDRLRAAGPRAHRHRQGGDRARHPDRAHADRRRGARRRAGAAAHRVGRDRCQPGRGLHLGQLLDRGRRRLDPPGLRRGARAVPRPPCRYARLPGRRSCRSRTDNSCAPARRPAATTGRSRARSSSSAARAAPRRPSCRRPIASSARNLPRIDLPAKLAGAAFIHDIAPEDVVHARVLRQPWRGARLVALDENGGAPRRQGADRDPARGRLRRLHGGERDRGDARRRGRPHARALGRRRAGSCRHRRAGLAQGAALARPHGRDRACPAAPARDRVVEARYSRPFLTYGSIGPSCALAEFKDGALKVWSHSQGPAVLRDWLARALGLRDLAGHGAPPPGRRRLRPQHRRRRGLRRRLPRHPDAGPHRAGAMVARGRVPVRADQHRHGDRALRAVLDADNRPADWTIEIWSPPHAQRPGMNGNSNLIGAEALPDAPPPQRAQRRAGRARRRRDPQRLCHLRPAASSADPSSAAARAAAHLLAARARRLGQCVRDRVLHGRAGGAGRRGPGAATGCRSSPTRARAAWSRPRRR